MHQELTNLEVTRTKFVAEPFVALDLEWRGHQPSHTHQGCAYGDARG